MALLRARTRPKLPLVIAVVLCVPMIGRAVDFGSIDEYRVKAAFLLNFLKFAQWPGAATNDALVIGVLLPDHFTAELDTAARSLKVAGRQVEVRRFRKLADVRGCDLLFVPRDAEYAPAELAKVGRLTVGETAQFLSSGGIINFYLRDNQVRFEIDPSAAERAGVRINAHVLQLGVRP
jgi:hypothetical protein